MEWDIGEYKISTNKSLLDVNKIHKYLSNEAYWAIGRTLEVVQRSIEHSLCYGVYSGSEQVGFARVVTDYATFAWLADVFILPEYRGKGLSKKLIEVILENSELQGLRRWLLATRDAHGLYERFGFRPLFNPEKWLAIETAQQ